MVKDTDWEMEKFPMTGGKTFTTGGTEGHRGTQRKKAQP